MNNNTSPTTWQDLDESNRAHYAAKRRPDWLRDAEDAARQAWKLADELNDDNPVDLRTLDAYRHANAAQAWLDDCRKLHSAGLTPASVNAEQEN